MLELAVVNSERDIEDHKMLKRVEYFACRRCKKRWTATLEQMMEHPECPKCQR